MSTTPQKNAIREKIDAMVKRAIVKTLFEAAPNPFAKKSDNNTIYASTDYSSIWDQLPPGEESERPSAYATQADFKRWFMKHYIESNTSPLRFETEPVDERMQYVEMFDQMTPDQMVEWINANQNDVFAFSPYDGNSMALTDILRNYVDGKNARIKVLNKSDEIDAIDAANTEREKLAAASGKTRVTQGEREDTLQTIQDLVATDPTEQLNSREAVRVRIRSGLGKLLRSEEAKEIMRLLFDKNADTNMQNAMMEMIDRLHDRISEITADYTDMFTDSMFESFATVGLPEEGEVNPAEESFNQQNILNQVLSSVAPGASSNDVAILKRAVLAPMGDGTNVLETIMNKSASDPGVLDAVTKTIMDTLETSDLEMEFRGAEDAADIGASTKAYEDFVRRFVSELFDAFTEEGPELQQAFAEGVADFAAKLKAAGVRRGVGSPELTVFESILMTDVDGTKRVVDLLLNGDAEDPVAYDEVWQAAYEKFRSENDKQTLFNSLGDYIDIQPDIKELRDEVFDTVRALSKDEVENINNVMQSIPGQS
jgi:hypothetical protein